MAFLSGSRRHNKRYLFMIGIAIVTIWLLLNVTGNAEPIVYVELEKYKEEIDQAGPLNSKMAIVVPFRDRWTQLKEFLPRMQEFLASQKIPHEFFIINQADDHRFNRATLINIGFLESRMCCSDMLVHDVDLVPVSRNIRYRQVFPGPYHVIPPEIHPKYHYEKFVGGVMLFSDSQFKKIDGLSNRFWGWGGEDDEMYKRFKDHDLKIYRVKNLPEDAFAHLHSESKPKNRDDEFIFNQLIVMYRRDRRTGLHNLFYHKNATDSYNVQGSRVNVINVTLTCDLQVTPWCYRLDQLSPEVKAQASKRNTLMYQIFDFLNYCIYDTI